MLRRLPYIFGFAILFATGYAQQGTESISNIILPEYSAANKLFLIYEDSIFQVLAPKDSINHLLKTLRQNDPLCIAFKELTSTPSTNFFLKMKHQGLAREIDFMTHEMLKKGSCEVINRKTGTKAKAITVKIYAWAEFSPKGFRYDVDGLPLYDYLNLID
jgi:hypothetical protein